ncbi:hypothetical protein D3C72_1775620 [compost metagenome]
MAQVRREEVRLARALAAVEPARADQHERRAVPQEAHLALGRGREGAVDAQHMVDPQLQRGRYREIVHRRVDDECVGLLQLHDQPLRPVKDRRVGRVRGDGRRIVPADRRQRLGHQIAFEHLARRATATGLHKGGDGLGGKAKAVTLLAVRATVQQKRAHHATPPAGSGSLKCSPLARSPWRK